MIEDFLWPLQKSQNVGNISFLRVIKYSSYVNLFHKVKINVQRKEKNLDQ